MTNMKIQYASDLHLEFADNWRYLKAHPLEVTGDILLLAGDIGYLGDDNYSKHPFWDWASENYKEVHCCMGNHEFYKYYDVATLPDGYLLEVRPNVFSHYNGIARIGDTDIILSTLWSRIPLEDAYFTEQVISDFRRILYKGELMTHAQFNAEHERASPLSRMQWHIRKQPIRLLSPIMYHRSVCSTQSFKAARQTWRSP